MTRPTLLHAPGLTAWQEQERADWYALGRRLSPRGIDWAGVAVYVGGSALSIACLWLLIVGAWAVFTH